MFVIDGSAMVWTLSWDKIAKVRDLVRSMNTAVSNLLREGDVFLVFDRYCDLSIKSYARIQRSETGSRVHKLHLNAMHLFLPR